MHVSKFIILQDTCIKKCVDKHINANHKMMEIFIEIEPVLVQRRIEEVQSAQASLEAQPQIEQSVQTTA